MIGGSGGGGGAATLNGFSTAGGNGGGAILIASSGVLTVSGVISARGGNGEAVARSFSAGNGGAAAAAQSVWSLPGWQAPEVLRSRVELRGLVAACGGGDGGNGRIRIETEFMDFNGTFAPAAIVSLDRPAPLFPATPPGFRITQIAGQTVPEFPTGNGDVILPETLSNPVTVNFAATDVPVGTELDLTVTPTVGAIVTATSTPLSGTDDSSTASAEVDLPQGASVLTASVEFAVTVAIGESLSPYAQGETVERVKIATRPGSGSTATLITTSGAHYPWPANTIASIGAH